MVGVNRYQDDAGVSPPIMRIDPGRGGGPGGPAAGLPGGRDPDAWAAAMDRLSRLRRRARENLVPALIDAVKAGGTLGEVSDRLRETWGRHRELVTV